MKMSRSLWISPTAIQTMTSFHAGKNFCTFEGLPSTYFCFSCLNHNSLTPSLFLRMPFSWSPWSTDPKLDASAAARRAREDLTQTPELWFTTSAQFSALVLLHQLLWISTRICTPAVSHSGTCICWVTALASDRISSSSKSFSNLTRPFSTLQRCPVLRHLCI